MPRLFESLSPLDPRDAYPLTNVNYQKGGWREVSTVEERDLITVERRQYGMAVQISGQGQPSNYAYKNTLWGLFPADPEDLSDNTGWKKLNGNRIVYEFNTPTNPITVTENDDKVAVVSIEHLFGYAPEVVILDQNSNECIAEIKHVMVDGFIGTTEFRFNFLHNTPEDPEGDNKNYPTGKIILK
jgi:hypothetical protein